MIRIFDTSSNPPEKLLTHTRQDDAGTWWFFTAPRDVEDLPHGNGFTAPNGCVPMRTDGKWHWVWMKEVI